MPAIFRSPRFRRPRRHWLPPSSGPADDVTLTLDPAALTFAGQAIPFANVAGLDAGAVEFAGQAILFAVTHALAPATLSFAGQVITFPVSFVLDPASLQIAG